MTEQLDEAAFSLADLAEIDLEGIEEVRYENMPKGVYEFEVTKADLVSDSKDGEVRYKCEVELTVVEMLSAIEPGTNRDKPQVVMLCALHNRLR
jgi:hypothetical protein